MSMRYLTVTALTLALFSQAGAEENPAYQAAVLDASQALASELRDDLLAVTPESPARDAEGQIKVVTWKATGGYERFIKPYTASSDNPEYGLWVTLAPQVHDFCHQWLAAHPEAGQAELELRLKQYLGLDPSWGYDLFVELAVAPEALFRPCVDPETDDHGCQLQFGKENPTVTGIADYRDFYEALYFKSFRASAGVPWTGLGYTYDWGNPESEVGASEFILKPSSAYQVVRVVPTLDYCRE